MQLDLISHLLCFTQTIICVGVCKFANVAGKTRNWGIKGMVNYCVCSPVNCNPYITSVFYSVFVFPPACFSDMEAKHEMWN